MAKKNRVERKRRLIEHKKRITVTKASKPQRVAGKNVKELADSLGMTVSGYTAQMNENQKIQNRIRGRNSANNDGEKGE